MATIDADVDSDGNISVHIENDIIPWRMMDGSHGAIINGKPITYYSAPRPPREPDKCEECGRTGPDLRMTQESDSVWTGEDDIYIPEEWHCADCRKKLDKEPVNDERPWPEPELQEGSPILP